ncbi:MAG: CHAT domain-containing protein [Bryobacterales bacterium]|nr:CHAT domain-containing protein [Bryobacterales bacterium]
MLACAGGSKAPAPRNLIHPPAYQPGRDQITKLAQTGRWREMALAAHRSSDEMAAAGDLRGAAIFDYAECQALFVQFEYGKALQAALRGRRHALAARDYSSAASSAFAIAAVYFTNGNYKLTAQAADEMMRYAQIGAPSRMIEFRGLMGAILRWKGDVPASLAQFRMALEEAEDSGDTEAVATMREQAGHSYLLSRRPDRAEKEFVEAFRLRTLFAPSTLGWAYRNLTVIALARRDGARALHFSNLAIATLPPRLRPNILYLGRAQAHLLLGNQLAAFADLEKAVSISRHLRLNLPFGDEIQIAADGGLQVIYSLLVDVAGKLYEETGDIRYAQAAFRAAQENRAASLLTRVGAGEAWRQRLPETYWTKLRQLRREEIALLRSPANLPSPELVRLRAGLTELESAAGLDLASPNPALAGERQLRRMISAGEALITFHLGEQRGWRWILTRDIFQMTGLPSRSLIAGQVKAFRGDVEKDLPDHAGKGERLYRLLFTGAPRDTPMWTIVPDDTLFQLPFAALVCGHSNGRPVYLAEQTVTRLAPTASFFANGSSAGSKRFLAVGDPVANRADPRWKPRPFAGFPWFRDPAAVDTLELPRLPGSVREIERCLRVWSAAHPAVSIEGPRITQAALTRELPHTLVLHLATHVYQPPSNSDSPVILLGLDAGGEVNVLTGADIAALTPAPALVTLSACGSGRGRLAPGSGLLGLTRAWLMAGTRSVTASLWPVLDDTGGLFEAYYQSLESSREGAISARAAQALQFAQVQSILEEPLRSRPSRWAAYFVIGAI